MSPFRNFSSDLKESDSGKVLLGDDYECKIKDMGSVRLSLLDETIKSLNDMRFVHELRRNFILLGYLYVIGYMIKIDNVVLSS